MNREESLAEGSWLCREEAWGGWRLCFGTQIWGGVYSQHPSGSTATPARCLWAA